MEDPNAMEPLVEDEIFNSRNENTKKTQQAGICLRAVIAILWIACAIFCIRWITNSLEGFTFASVEGIFFNWHPLLMTIGPLFVTPLASGIYRMFNHSSRTHERLKLIHASLHCLSSILACLALWAVVRFHNVKNIPNFYSLHSFLGIFGIVSYLLLSLLSLAIFYGDLKISTLSPVKFVVNHRVSGTILTVLVFPLSAATGIVEKMLFAKSCPGTPACSEGNRFGFAVFLSTLSIAALLFNGKPKPTS